MIRAFDPCYTIKLYFAAISGIIFYNVYFHNFYRRQLRLGVERDIERQESNKLKKLQQETQLVEPLVEAAKQGPILQTT